jgi:hypothetical protein
MQRGPLDSAATVPTIGSCPRPARRSVSTSRSTTDRRVAARARLMVPRPYVAGGTTMSRVVLLAHDRNVVRAAFVNTTAMTTVRPPSPSDGSVTSGETIVRPALVACCRAE